jgi:uncharacterized membrane protein YfhO
MISKKTLISIAAVVAIAAPLVPKTVNLNITMEQPSKKEKSYRSVETVCDIKTKTVSDNKFLICEYQCRGGDKISIYRTYYNASKTCPDIVTERINKKD